jgi:hypothetical protein
MRLCPYGSVFHSIPCKTFATSWGAKAGVLCSRRGVFKKLAPDLNTTQEKLFHGALRLFMSRFKGVPEYEKQAVWEAIKKEAAGGTPHLSVGY